MNIYLDLEFSALTDNAEAISVGAVAANGAEFYVELDPLPATCSDFVTQHVLPLLQGGTFACPRQEFASRLEAWLQQFDEPIQFIADSSWDWFVLRRALGAVGEGATGDLQIGRTCVTLVTTIPSSGAVGEAYETARLQCFLRDPRQHHALVDARALRAAELSLVSSQASDAIARLQSAPRFIHPQAWDQLASSSYEGPIVSGNPTGFGEKNLKPDDGE